MIKIIDLKIPAKDIKNKKFILGEISKKISIRLIHINDFNIMKKSIDARNKKIQPKPLPLALSSPSTI